MVEPSRSMLRVFVVFGAGYLLSSALRGVTATLAPSFVQTFHLQPAQLGILGGMYFLGFALMQLPAGAWLDRFGSRPVLSVSLLLAALGSYLFATAESFAGLVVARFACGVGVSACLIAPLTSARMWLSPPRQQQKRASRPVFHFRGSQLWSPSLGHHPPHAPQIAPPQR